MLECISNGLRPDLNGEIALLFCIIESPLFEIASKSVLKIVQKVSHVDYPKPLNNFEFRNKFFHDMIAVINKQNHLLNFILFHNSVN